MFCTLPHISFPVTNLYNCNISNSSTSEHEMLLVNGPHHQFAISDLSNLLFPSNAEKSSFEQNNIFIEEFNRLKPLWKPVSFIQEHCGQSRFQIHLYTNTTYSNLIHTGPWKMRLGDALYVIPPLYTATGHLVDSNPYSFVYKPNMNTYMYPMLISDTDFIHLKRAWISIQLGNLLRTRIIEEAKKTFNFDEIKTLIDSDIFKPFFPENPLDPLVLDFKEMDKSTLKDIGKFEKYIQQINAEYIPAMKNSNLAQILGPENLSKLKSVTSLKPIGEIVCKRDNNPYCISQNDVRPGDVFTIRWFD